jgi:hypothetical protein
MALAGAIISGQTPPGKVLSPDRLERHFFRFSFSHPPPSVYPLSKIKGRILVDSAFRIREAGQPALADPRPNRKILHPERKKLIHRRPAILLIARSALLAQTPGDRIRPEKKEDQTKTKNQMPLLEPHRSSKDKLLKILSEILRKN